MTSPAAPRVILASASPRRQAILRSLGITFEVRPAGIDEAALSAGSPRALVMKIAAAKADAAARTFPDPKSASVLILAADTEVVRDGVVLGKPADRADARRMLRSLSGRAHDVISAVALKSLPGGEVWIHAERTEVRFHPLSDEFIADYAESGEPDDKAGAYGIQGMGGGLVAGLRGSVSNVIGLPLATLNEGWRVMTGGPLRGAEDEKAVLQRAFPDMFDFIARA